MAKEEELKDVKRKLENLQKQVDRIESDSGKKDSSSKKVVKKEVKSVTSSDNRRHLRTLIILIVIVLVIDVLSLLFYFGADLSDLFTTNIGNDSDIIDDVNGNDNGLKCEDGTPFNSCSEDKPYYCYQGQLVKKAVDCGCPLGKSRDFQNCK
ncbi:hypothetical protein GOV12_01295 [Candidatus Pacearchaeota archaeon]|nr:hypothetical protein [Candidatus Pacearchaeota archaeon]